MNYASHQNTEACQCRGQTGLPQIFCTTGHITECHFPFSCTEAACNHLPKYQEIGQEIGQKLETTAREIFSIAAQPQCEKCGGMGLQQITETILVPGIDPPNGKPVFEFAVNTVCACVNIERTPGRNPARLCTNNGSWFDYLFKLVGKAQNSGLSDDPYRFWLGLLAVGARRCLAWAWRF